MIGIVKQAAVLLIGWFLSSKFIKENTGIAVVLILMVIGTAAFDVFLYDMISGINKNVSKIDDDVSILRVENRDESNELKQEIYKLTIYNDRYDVPTRLYAGMKYIEAGGNSETKRYVEEFRLQYMDVWQAILFSENLHSRGIKK